MEVCDRCRILSGIPQYKQKQHFYKKIKETTSLSYTDKNRTEGKKYYYKVRAVKKVADKVYSYSTYSSQKSARNLKTPVISSVTSYSGEKLKVKMGQGNWCKLLSALSQYL